MKRKFRKLLKKAKNLPAAVTPEPEINSSPPRITTNTINEHREEILGRARKYIYPLQHSKHRVVLISMAIFITVTVIFFSYCAAALYKLRINTGFLYGVTKVIPFPIARSGGKFIAYENYLFELRRYTHYYVTQQKLDFKSDAGKQQLADFRRRAMNKIVDDFYVKQLAAQRKVSVSNQEIDQVIAIVRSQNRLGSSDQVFEDVLRDYWGWRLDDFKRSLHNELLAQKVIANLDRQANLRALTALNELKAGADFADVAKKYSDDLDTKTNGGEFGYPISRTTRSLTAQTTDALFKLKPGQFSDIINTGNGLEIVKNIETNGDRIRAAHIIFNFKDINSYLNDFKEKQPTRTFVTF